MHQLHNISPVTVLSVLVLKRSSWRWRNTGHRKGVGIYRTRKIIGVHHGVALGLGPDSNMKSRILKPSLAL